jgi:hypothetical protein
MPRSTRTAQAHPNTDHPDLAELDRKVESLQREVARLRAELDGGPRDNTWFTPGVIGLLALGLFFALWVKYEPVLRRRAEAPAPSAQSATPGEYNPPPAPSGG